MVIPYAVTSWIESNLSPHKDVRKQVLHRRWMRKIKEREMKSYLESFESWNFCNPEAAITKYYMSIAEYRRSVYVYMYFMTKDNTRREFKWKEERKMQSKLDSFNKLNPHWSEQSWILLKYNLHTWKLDVDPIRFLFFVKKKHGKETNS